MTGLRRFPWVSGLVVAVATAFWLIYVALDDAATVISNVVDTAVMP